MAALRQGERAHGPSRSICPIAMAREDGRHETGRKPRIGMRSTNHLQALSGIELAGRNAGWRRNGRDPWTGRYATPGPPDRQGVATRQTHRLSYRASVSIVSARLARRIIANCVATRESRVATHRAGARVRRRDRRANSAVLVVHVVDEHIHVRARRIRHQHEHLLHRTQV